MSTEEPETPVRIGAGSFAVVYVISGGLIAFKEVSHTDNSEELHQEYHTLCNVYLRCNTDSFFAIPRALAFSNPLAGEFSTTATSPPSAAWPRATRALVTSDVGLFPATDVHNEPGPRFTPPRSSPPYRTLLPPEGVPRSRFVSSIFREGLHGSASIQIFQHQQLPP